MMLRTSIISCILFFGFLSCAQPVSEVEALNVASSEPIELKPIIQPQGRTILTRYKPPEHFKRIKTEPGSFGSFLRQLTLKPVGTEVAYFDGRKKSKSSVANAVIDLPIGNQDLHQCADAIIRLRADYWYQQKAYDSIRFKFTNGFVAEYAQWRQGYRIHVEGNHSYWVKTHDKSESPQSYWAYLEMVFRYAGTLSLSKELRPVKLSEIQPGDVFIQGGSPGHAIIVVDLAKHPITGETLALLAQSYMPAQEIHILNNYQNTDYSPWFSMSFGKTLYTPEWNFSTNDLKRF